MRNFQQLTLVLSLLVPGISAAHADPLDIEAWTKRFTQAVSQTDADGAIAAVNEAKDPRLNTTQVKPAMQDFFKYGQNQPSLFAETVSDEKVGTVFDRVTIAVMYKTGPLFYTVTFMHEEDWKLVQVLFNTDYNKVKNLEWPH